MPDEPEWSELRESLTTYLERVEEKPWVPLAVDSAVERYFTWNRVNPSATDAAKLDLVESLGDLYRLDRYGESARYQLFLGTLFLDASTSVRDAFDRLISALYREPTVSALRRVELSDLQNELRTDEERTAFRSLAFPRGLSGNRPEIITFGDAGHRRVAMLTRVHDRLGAGYEVREPVEPEEIGLLYRLFFRRRFPKKVGEFDQHLLCLDEGGRIVAGVCYQRTREDAAHMDGVVVVPALEGRGLATVLLDDFCRRLASVGVEVVQTGFFMRAFCEKRGFVLHPRWSGLVRFLAEDA
jgi:GNAT superfamily N-acetyltransferase